jgi:hypothetical protein
LFGGIALRVRPLRRIGAMAVEENLELFVIHLYSPS